MKVVYKETEQQEKPFIAEGILVDGNPSFICLRGEKGLVHFIATDRVVRVSERFKERETREG